MTVFSSGKPSLHLPTLLIFLTSFVFISLINSEFDIIYYIKLKHRCVLLSGRSGPTSKKESTSVTKKTNTHFHPDKKKRVICHLLCLASHIIMYCYYYVFLSENSRDILQCSCTEILYKIKMLRIIFGTC